MKKTIAILLASTALAVGAGIPAWSAIRDAAHPAAGCEAASAGSAESGKDSLKGHDHGHRPRRDADRRRHHEGDDDDDGQQAGPAPAAAPGNGLFGNGAAPVARVK